MARLKHIAIRTGDVAKTAAFYKEAFDLEEVGKGRSGIYLSDGHINMAILNLRTPTSPAGVEHFGFQVDNLEKAVERVTALGGGQLTDLARINPTDPSHPQSYFEVKVTGPEEQEIDVSDTGWVGAPRDK
ncbi:MAG: VOC family protein [Deltaproteobacteria bacterium]|nr:VOC family protein [Deltaproteobacteria bacterium]MDE0341790.1 VOC family protein [Deltaproteobacteria bacterium]